MEYILIGGLAANAHGAIRTTRDVDVVCARSRANLERLETTLLSLRPYPRGAPPGLPFRLDLATLQSGLNFALTTDLGELDLLGEVAGGGRYDDLVPHSVALELFGLSCRCVSLEGLIHLKRAAGRPRDFEAVAALEALAEVRRRRQPD